MDQAAGVRSLRDFTKASLEWCSKEAENGTEQVTAALDVLLKDIERVSRMSKDSLKALNELKAVLDKVDKTNYQQLQTSLQALSREHGEIDTYIQPIMEALQFQDRFRQNLENVVRMIDIWVAYRDRPELKAMAREDSLKAFGEELLKVTTMKRERDIVRAQIPGLPAEAESVRAILF